MLILAGGTAGLSAQTFLGKDVDAWRRQLSSALLHERRSAAFALGKLGNGGAPALAALKKALVEEKEASVREAVAFALGEIGRDSLLAGRDAELVPVLVRGLKDADPLVRRSAAYALGCLAEGADAALPALAESLGDTSPAVRQNAAWALGKLGGPAVPPLRRALQDADALVQRDAAAALTQVPPDAARAALPELLQLCRSGNSQSRRAALDVLLRVVGPDDKTALPALQQALLDSEIEVRRNAALALSNIGGPEAVPALNVLIDALRRGEPELRRQAAAAIRNLGPGAKAAVPYLVAALRDVDEETRGNVALALGGLEKAAEAAYSPLVERVADRKETDDNRFKAATALSRLGSAPDAAKALPTLLDILIDPDQNGRVRWRIVWALRAHQENLRKLPGIFPAFTRVLGEKPETDNRMLRYDCAYMLGMLQGAEAPDAALDVLREYLDDDTIRIFRGARSSVGGTGLESGSGKASFAEVGTGDGRVLAIQALRNIGSARVGRRKDIVAKLEDLARTAMDPDLKMQAAELAKAAK